MEGILVMQNQGGIKALVVEKDQTVVESIELVLKDAEAVTFGDHFPPSNEMIDKLLEKEVTIMACPGCMAVKGVTEDMLMDGVIVANKNKFFNFTKGGILTLDY